jgi:hypothetical protein
MATTVARVPLVARVALVAAKVGRVAVKVAMIDVMNVARVEAARRGWL